MGWFARGGTVQGRRAVVAGIVGLCACMVLIGTRPSAGQAAGTDYNWTQFDFNGAHNGDDTAETRITRADVASLAPLFTVSIPTVDGAPVYLSNVSTSTGTRNLLFTTSRDGDITATDADTGAQVWVKHNGPGSCTVNNGSNPCFTTSAPAIDPNLKYVYSYGLDGYVHKYQVGDGTEITGGGWPELVTTKPYNEKGSSTLSVATSGNSSYLYATSSGYPGDQGDYQGHVTTINLATGAQHVFNTLCSNQTAHFVETPGTPDCAQVQAAVWARPGTVYSSATNRIYLATGNGTFNPSGFDWGDSVLALNPNGTGSGNGNPLDSYTPVNYQTLQDKDLDLGSTAPAILTRVPSGSAVAHVGVQGGKDAVLRLINLSNLSGTGGPGHTDGVLNTVTLPQGGEILTQPAVWIDALDGSTRICVTTANGAASYKVQLNSANVPVLQLVWSNTTGGTSPIVAHGVLFYATSGHIQALNADTGAALWSASIGGIHWESPIVANGHLYVADFSGNLRAFALPPAPTPVPTS